MLLITDCEFQITVCTDQGA